MPESDVSRRELERQIMELKREKGRIEDNIRRMDNNQKRADEARARDAAREEAKENEKTNDEPEKKRKRDDRSGSEDSKASKKSKNGKSDDEKKDDDDKEEKKKEDRRKKDDTRPKQTDKRSRAMFGGLLGHLKSAKTRLETEKGWESTQKRNEAMQKTQMKIETESASQMEKRKTLWVENRKDEEAKRAEITQTIAEKEATLLQRRLESHYGLMMNYIRTKAEPTIFYLPARGTKKTDVLLDETRDAIKHKIKSLKGQLKPMPEEEMTDRATAAAAATEAALGETDKKDAKSDDEASIPDGAPRTAVEAEGEDKKDEKEEKKDDEDEKKEKGDDSD